MRFRLRSRHIIDLIFPILLFCIFTLSALTVLLLSANVYRSATQDAARRDDAHTAVSYITEKVRRFDTAGSITPGEFDGCSALVLQQTIDDTAYSTYIYIYEDTLREIFLKEGTQADAAHGTEILGMTDFSAECFREDLLCISCTDMDGRSASILLALRAEGGNGS